MTHIIIRPMKIALLALGLAANVTLAATAEIPNLPENSFNNILTPDNSFNKGGSLLDSLQQAEQESKKTKYLEALNLIKANKLEAAKAKVNDLIKQFPKESAYLDLEALIAVQEKNPEAAKQSYEKALALNPNDMTATLGMARIAIDAKDLDKAKGYAEKAISINAKSVPGHLLLADIVNNQQQTGQVESVLRNGYEKVKGNAAAEIELATALAKWFTLQKQPEKAVAITQEVAGNHPQDTAALSLLAGAQAAGNDKAGAAQTLNKIIDQDKNDWIHRIALAQILSDQPDKEKQILSLLDEAIKAAPDQPQAEIFKASYLTRLKRFPEALELAKKIDGKNPKSAAGKLLKADIYLAQKQLDKALEADKEAYKIQPNSKTMSVIAEILTAQGKSKEAVAFLQGELPKTENPATIHFLLGTIYQRENNPAEATKHYEEVLAKQPENAIVLNNLAVIYAEEKNPKALQMAKKAYDIYPQSPAIIDTYGTTLLKVGQAKESVSIMQKAVELAPKNPDLQFHLAQSLNANGDNKQAMAILEKILQDNQQGFSEKTAAEALLKQLKSN
ncbi:MAG: PEP-CTERM system TPR-repeat protein PrsT [Methylomonas sp.]|nr:MAG: PEP-CTERM system TPR-repeat protein PrsT [Methylobacter sp.]PPD36511.1 MAG: PEP-CTERM system TPR-repeat protein PrsT [Methylomonas sp.]